MFLHLQVVQSRVSQIFAAQNERWHSKDAKDTLGICCCRATVGCAHAMPVIIGHLSQIRSHGNRSLALLMHVCTVSVVTQHIYMYIDRDSVRSCSKSKRIRVCYLRPDRFESCSIAVTISI